MFQFKKFTVHQDRTAMKVGTDGVLLGAWCDLTNVYELLDVGTGTGLIALMAAQRDPDIHIDAIEIESQAFKQAQENFIESPWHDRIDIFNTSLQDFLPHKQYDCIVCNPPFFNNSTKAPENNRSLARHTDTLSHSDLLKHASRLLKETGHLCLILPTQEAQHIQDIANQFGLFPKKTTTVYPTPTKAAKRLLIHFTKQKLEIINDEIILELERHKYSPQYIELTRDFYLYI